MVPYFILSANTRVNSCDSAMCGLHLNISQFFLFHIQHVLILSNPQFRYLHSHGAAAALPSKSAGGLEVGLLVPRGRSNLRCRPPANVCEGLEVGLLVPTGRSKLRAAPFLTYTVTIHGNNRFLLLDTWCKSLTFFAR